MESRKFKGIWIPAEIWEDTTISASAKILWGEIYALSDRED